MHHDPFSLWVAKAIADCGGDSAAYLAEIEAEVTRLRVILPYGTLCFVDVLNPQ